MARIGIISGGGFKKIHKKDRVYIKIIRKVQFDGVVADNLFDSVFARITILLCSAGLLGEQVPGIQPHQIADFLLSGWTAMSMGVAFVVGLCYKHVVL